MSVYGNLIKSSNIEETSISLESFLESFSKLDNFFKEYDKIMIECNVFNNIINENSNEILLEFSFKSIWDKFLKMLKMLWDKIKELSKKFKLFFKNKKVEKLNDELNKLKKEYSDLEATKNDLDKDIESILASNKDLKEKIKLIEAKMEELGYEKDYYKGKLKEKNKELDKTKEDLESSRKELAAQKALAKLKCDEAISNLMSNPLIYFDPKMLLNSYHISFDNYLNAFDRIKTTSDIDKIKHLFEDAEIAKIYQNIFTKDILDLSNENDGFKYGGLDHADLHRYIENKLNEIVKIKNYNPNDFVKMDLHFINSVPALNNLIDNSEQVVQKTYQVIERYTRINMNNWEQMAKQVPDDKKSDYMNAPDSIKSLIDMAKKFTNLVSSVVRVASVAANFEGQCVGAVKTTVVTLKPLLSMRDSL